MQILNEEAGPSYAEDNYNIDLSTIEGYVTVKEVSFIFQSYDEYKNIITKGGEHFTSKGKMG